MILDQAIKDSPKVFSSYFARAQMMCAEDDYLGCKGFYTKGIELAPPMHRGMFTQNLALELGQAAYRVGQKVGNAPKSEAKAALELRKPFETALKELDTALSLNENTPAWVRALYTKGQVHEALAKADQGGWANSESAKKSTAAWDEVLQRLTMSPDLASELSNLHPDCHTNVGVSYERLDRLAEAEVQYRAALALRPNHHSALAHLRDVVHWQYPDKPEKWHAVAQQGIDQGIWERIDQTPAPRYHIGVQTTPWPAVSSYPWVIISTHEYAVAKASIHAAQHSCRVKIMYSSIL